jgi:hypothetical protein
MLATCDLILHMLQAQANREHLNQEQIRHRVEAAAQRLRVDHHCKHQWQRRTPAVTMHCQNCRFYLNCYGFYCDDCARSVCYVCRYHRRVQ